MRDFNERFNIDNVTPISNSRGGKGKGQRARGAREMQHNYTTEQRDFCTYINQDIKEPKELVVYLDWQDGKEGVVKEVRGIDFSLKKSYKIYPPNKRYEIVEGILPILGNWTALMQTRKSGYYVFTWKFSKPRAENKCPIEIDEKGYFAPLTAEQLVKAIRNAKINAPSFSASETSGLYETLEKQLSEAGDDVFIYELLQNASDKPFDENACVDVRIGVIAEKVIDGKRRGGYLSFCHSGAKFTYEDVAAICSANQKSKSHDVGAIGYKGIGFKTVFRYNKRVEIRSGKFGFAFDEDTVKDRPELPWMTTPPVDTSKHR